MPVATFEPALSIISTLPATLVRPLTYLPRLNWTTCGSNERVYDVIFGNYVSDTWATTETRWEHGHAILAGYTRGEGLSAVNQMLYAVRRCQSSGDQPLDFYLQRQPMSGFWHYGILLPRPHGALRTHHWLSALQISSALSVRPRLYRLSLIEILDGDIPASFEPPSDGWSINLPERDDDPDPEPPSTTPRTAATTPTATTTSGATPATTENEEPCPPSPTVEPPTP